MSPIPWLKVDDKHHDHRKTRRALRGVSGKRRDASAIGLWVLAGAWVADNLMDGFVPTDELDRWDDDAQRLAQRLVDADFWEPAEREGEPGFHFINWEEHQPMKADVEAKRQAAKERMARIRSTPRGSSDEVRANKEGSSRRPTRPDPSRPVGTDVPVAAAPLTDERFDEFWDVYSHKVGRRASEKAWTKALKKPGVSADALIAAASSYISWQILEGKHPQFTKHAATWLNGEHWSDERVARPAPRTRVQEHMALAEDLAGEQLRQIAAGR